MTIEELITHPDKVFWPDEGYSKIHLARYYDAIFPKLRPYVDDRLLSLERCPDGMLGNCFYQKAAPKGLPKGTPTHRIQHQNREVEYVVGGLKDTELALVNLGCIPVHVWASRASHPQQPDWMVFDLDPTSGKFADAAKAGLVVKDELDRLGLTSFPKTSGSRGLHVFVPLRLGPTYDEVLPFANRAYRLPLVAFGDKYLHIGESMVYEDRLPQPLTNGFCHVVMKVVELGPARQTARDLSRGRT